MRWYERLYVGEKAKKVPIFGNPGGAGAASLGILCADAGCE